MLLFPSLLTGCALAPLAIQTRDKGDFLVRPVYLVPADQKTYPQYEEAILSCVLEIQEWYKAKAGRTFEALPLETIRAQEDYLTMRCGQDPVEREKGLEDKHHMPNWYPSVREAVGGWRPRTATWVFAQGGGGYVGANLQGDFAGFAFFGDWVLEPISQVANPDGIPASLCESKIFVTGGTPKGTTAHELGHAFGLHHPERYENARNAIMMAHWTYPDGILLPHEQLILKYSPFTARRCWTRGAPFLDYATPDEAYWGGALNISSRGARSGDKVEFIDVNGVTRVEPNAITSGHVKVTVPDGVGPGLIRLRRGRKRSNAVPINVYDERPPDG